MWHLLPLSTHLERTYNKKRKNVKPPRKVGVAATHWPTNVLMWNSASEGEKPYSNGPCKFSLTKKDGGESNRFLWQLTRKGASDNDPLKLKESTVRMKAKQA